PRRSALIGILPRPFVAPEPLAPWRALALSWTRRRFLLTVSSAAAAGALAPADTLAQTLKLPHLRRKQPVVPAPIGFVYFGTDTDKHVSKGIYRAHFDATSG